MNDPLLQFRHLSEKLHVTPPANAWTRVREKLREEKVRHRVRRLRITRLAAVFLCLIAASAGLVLVVGRKYGNTVAQYSRSIEELKSTRSSGESIYDVARIREYRAALEVHRNAQ